MDALHIRTTLVAGLVWSGLAAAPAGAAVFDVNTTTDMATCPGPALSLRCAVIASNLAGGTNTIDVPAGDYTLTLTGAGEDAAQTGDLDVTAGDLTIAGAGAGAVRIHGSGDRVFDVPAGANTTGLTLMGVTITNGTSAPGDVGGGLSFAPAGAATLEIDASAFTSNTATNVGTTGGNFGGAISFDPGAGPSTFTVTDSTFDSNTAESGTSSGGGFGGAIDAEPNGAMAMTVSGSTFSGNVAAGSSSQGGFGGGINFDPGSGTLDITNSTFNANHANGPGGFGGAVEFETGTATLTNVTIAGNSAGFATGGGGFDNSADDAVSANSILANNSGGDCGSIPVDERGENLDSDGTCNFALTPADPNLAGLADNGGPTFTMALISPSPAIDAGDNPTCAATDQRGGGRPVDGDGDTVAICDLGAFELGALPVSGGGGSGAGGPAPASQPAALGFPVPPAPTAPSSALPAPPPVPLVSGNVERVSGVVYVVLPITRRVLRIEDVTSIPVGSYIDATHGVVRLTVARDRRGGVQTGLFSRGAFYFRQSVEKLRVFGKPHARVFRELVTELTMAGGGSPLTCPRGSSGRRPAGPQRLTLARKRFVRYLQAQASGHFRVIGRHSSGLERGTNWLTRDDCSGTLTTVTSGSVLVTDFTRHRIVLVKAGRRYLATGRK